MQNETVEDFFQEGELFQASNLHTYTLLLPPSVTPLSSPPPHTTAKPFPIPHSPQVDDTLSPLEAIFTYAPPSNLHVPLRLRISYIYALPEAITSASASSKQQQRLPTKHASKTSILTLLKDLSADKELEIRLGVATMLSPLSHYILHGHPPSPPPLSASSGTSSPRTPRTEHSTYFINTNTHINVTNKNKKEEEKEKEKLNSGSARISNSNNTSSSNSSAYKPATARQGEELIKTALRLLHDPEMEVQEVAEQAVCTIAVELPSDLRSSIILPHIQRMMMPPAESSSREAAVRIVTGMLKMGAAEREPGWCEHSLTPLLMAFSGDKESYSVRMHSVAGLAAMLPHMPRDRCEDSLIPAFTQLCSDPIWSVRSECAQLLPVVAAGLSEDQAVDLVPRLYEGFRGDKSRWVRDRLHASAGELMAVLPLGCLPTCLPDDFAAAAGSREERLATQCAACLTNALAALSSSTSTTTISASSSSSSSSSPPTQDSGGWKVLLPAVNALATSYHPAVRASFATLLPTAASSLPPTQAAIFLPPLMDVLMCDDSQDVVEALSGGLTHLLPLLPEDDRSRVLEQFLNINIPFWPSSLAEHHNKNTNSTNNGTTGTIDGTGTPCGNWRGRAYIAESIAHLAVALGSAGPGVEGILLPTALRLCEDPVAAVRHAACRSVGLLLRDEHGGGGSSSSSSNHSGEEEENRRRAMAAIQQSILENMLEFQCSQSYKKRQCFLAFAQRVLLLGKDDRDSDGSDGDVYCRQGSSSSRSGTGLNIRVLEAVVECADDRVANIRFATARLLAQYRHQQHGIEEEDEDNKVDFAIEKLRNDEDADVREAACF